MYWWSVAYLLDLWYQIRYAFNVPDPSTLALVERYAEVVEAVEASGGWVTSIRASTPPLTLLGSLDGIEAGLRQLRRTTPLEVEEHRLPGGQVLRVPTLAEMLRIKAYLVVQRNVVRDYLDTAALADRLGIDSAADVLTGIDGYYADRSNEADSVLTTLVVRLSQPTPRDVSVLRRWVGTRASTPGGRSGQL